MYNQQRKELKYIAKLLEDKMGAEFSRDLNNDGLIDVCPSSDPNYPTKAHRTMLAQTKLNLALQAPQVHNLPEAFREFYESLGTSPETINKLVPVPEEAQPQDPLTDIISASNGLPIKAFERTRSSSTHCC